MDDQTSTFIRNSGGKVWASASWKSSTDKSYPSKDWEPLI